MDPTEASLARDELDQLYRGLRKINDMHDRARRDHVAVLDANDYDYQTYESVVLILALEGMQRRRDDLLERIAKHRARLTWQIGRTDGLCR